MTDDDLWWWAERIREWNGQRRGVFVYFNNDGAGNAVRNAETLKAMIAHQLWPTRDPDHVALRALPKVVVPAKAGTQ